MQLITENLEAALISFTNRVRANARCKDLILLHKLILGEVTFVSYISLKL